MATHNNSTVNPRIRERDAGLRRLRRTTAIVVAAAGALSVAFGELAANAFSGRSGTAKTHAAVGSSSPTKHAATPPPLVSSGSAVQAPAAQAPAQSQAPPVAVSGGT